MLITPQSKTLYVNQTQQFVVTGGTAPYTYSIDSPIGLITSPGGLYMAPSIPTVAVVTATDAANNKAYGVVTVTTVLTVTPSSKTLGVNDTFTFVGSGGVPPYTFSIVTGSGVVTSAGFYTAPASSGSAVIEVKDSAGNLSYGAITVTPVLGISPATVNVATLQTYIFSANGGTQPYTYSLVAGGGSVASNGLFTAPGTAGTSLVRVTDATANISQATVTVFVGPTISPTSKSVGTGKTTTFAVTGGTAPYTFSIIPAAGSGTLSSLATSTTLTAPAAPGTAVVRVTDANSYTSDAQVTYFIPKVPGLGNNISCMVHRADSVASALKCWGYNYSYGTLGTFRVSIGDNPGEMGNAITLANVELGTSAGLPIVPIELSSNTYNTCIKASDGRLKCWGHNVGLGTGLSAVEHIGQYAEQMGDNLYYTNLGTGKTVQTVTGGKSSDHYNFCAILGGADAGADPGSGKVKCWGRNDYWQLGLGNNTAGYGYFPAQSGDNLAYVNLGTGRTAVQLSMGNYFSCALLDSGAAGSRVKCWGYNPYGNLGYEDIVNLTAPKGDNLASDYLNLGTVNGDGSGGALYAKQIAVGSNYSVCALLSNNKVKCWGYETDYLGYGDAVNRKGHTVGTMGDALPYVDFGTTGTIVSLKAGYSKCALFDNGKLKCFGHNTFGSLGLGDVNHRGDEAGEMGDSLPFADLGTGRTVVKYATAGYHTCAILDAGAGSNSHLKCWGYNLYGQLGLGHNYNVGTHPATLADNLPYVDLGTYSNGTPKIATDVTANYYHTCAILDDNSVKCWGYDGDIVGRLGTGNTIIGDTTAEINALSAVDLGTTRTALSPVVDLKSAPTHSCARFADGGLKCWGYNAYGQLGTGDATNRGDAPVTGTMGDTLFDVSLGTGRTVSDFDTGSYHTCAILDSGALQSRLKCWGYNGGGNLGLGDAVNRISMAQLGDNLPYVNLGTVDGVGGGGSLVATQVGVSSQDNHFSCVLLSGGANTGRIKCFGYNLTYGQLGLGDVATRGLLVADMGDNLAYVNLGTVDGAGGGGNLTASQISVGNVFTCALLSGAKTGRIKCWGDNTYGQLGNGDNAAAKYYIGDAPGEMGDALSFVDLGTVNGDGTGGMLLASKIVAGGLHACAIISNALVNGVQGSGKIKCWGYNGNGVLGTEDGSIHGGTANTMGDFLKFVNLGTINGNQRLVIDIFAGAQQTCAVLDNNDVKCWGYNLYSQLGLSHRYNIGATPLSMGEYLPVILPFKEGL